MELFDWSEDKNEWLLAQRNVTFEEVVYWIMRGGLLDILEHPNTKMYPNQQLFIVNIDDYAYIVPFIEDNERVYLKTIIPSRKMTRKYMRPGSK